MALAEAETAGIAADPILGEVVISLRSRLSAPAFYMAMRLKLSTKCQEETSLELSTPSSREATGAKGVAHTCPRNRMLLVELLVAETYHEAIASGDQWVKSSFDSLCAHQQSQSISLQGS